MNQILSVENTKKTKKNRSRRGSTIEVDKILKFFAIVMLIFGIMMTGTGAYAMFQNSKSSSNSAKPSISIEQTATELKIKITHNKDLEKVTYNWNNEEPTDIDCKGKKNVEATIDIPTGKNTLNIYAKDTLGLESNSTTQYTLLGDINIEFEVVNSNIKVKVEGKEELSYMTYRWDEEEETRVEIGEIETEQTIPVPSGQHKLTVVAVDINNKTETKEQEVKGVSKPKVEITTDGSDNFLIKAEDEEGIKKVEFIINETDRNMLNLDQVLPIEERKQFEYSYPLHDGENKLEVRVYNENDVSEVFKALVRK